MPTISANFDLPEEPQLLAPGGNIDANLDAAAKGKRYLVVERADRPEKAAQRRSEAGSACAMSGAFPSPRTWCAFPQHAVSVAALNI